jgi:hypothetical protein
MHLTKLIDEERSNGSVLVSMYLAFRIMTK